MCEKKDMNIRVGLRIKAAREGAGLTQEQLSERIDVTPQYVSDLERGVVGISTATLCRLCTELCISADSLLFGSRTENEVEEVAKRMSRLPKEQYRLLLNIINSFIQAIGTRKDI